MIWHLCVFNDGVKLHKLVCVMINLLIFLLFELNLLVQDTLIISYVIKMLYYVLAHILSEPLSTSLFVGIVLKINIGLSILDLC